MSRGCCGRPPLTVPGRRAARRPLDRCAVPRCHRQRGRDLSQDRWRHPFLCKQDVTGGSCGTVKPLRSLAEASRVGPSGHFRGLPVPSFERTRRGGYDVTALMRLEYGPLSRGVERQAPPRTAGRTANGRLTQRESTSFTRRESQVRTLHRPPANKRPATCGNPGSGSSLLLRRHVPRPVLRPRTREVLTWKFGSKPWSRSSRPCPSDG